VTDISLTVHRFVSPVRTQVAENLPAGDPQSSTSSLVIGWSSGSSSGDRRVAHQRAA